MTIGITGANGFVGARVSEMLAASGTQLKLIARRASDTQNHLVVDLRDPVAVRAIVMGCDAVVHCAFDFQDLEANLPIASVLADQCALLGVRLVHVSTAAVHEPFPVGELDESHAAAGGGSDYKKIKTAIEHCLIGAVRRASARLDLVILQPTVVYGPYGRAWTDSPVRELLTGKVVLPNNGDGLCNAVYIDDVCQAVIAALAVPIPSGERFLVSGPAPVLWRDFYAAYRDMLGIDGLELRPAAQNTPCHEEPGENEASHPNPRLTQLKSMIVRTLGTRRVTRLGILSGSVRSLILGDTVHIPTGAKLALLAAQCHIRTDKARRLLGYEPRFSLERGMAMTAPYVQSAYGRMARLKRKRSRNS